MAQATLPQLSDINDAYRLFLAETLLDKGMTPRALMKALGLDASSLNLIKYDPDQPRVPAGNGRESGRWGPASDGSSAFLAPAADAPTSEAAERRSGGVAPDGTRIDLAASADDPQGLKAARAAANAAGLTRAERRAFHDLITGLGITDFQELVDMARSVKNSP